MFLSHRLEHLSQAQKTFQRVFGSTRSYGRVLQGLDQSGADFVFATIQSADHSPTLRNRSFDYVVIDEFHHADAPSYREIIRKIPMRFMLGLTATPERQDGHDVLHFCDFNVAYEVRLIEAIGRGWLLPFHYFGVSDKTVDYSSIPWRSGRFDYDELENALMLDERVEEILRHSIEKGFDGSRRATVCFCAGIRHAKFMAARLNERGQNAVAVTSEIASLEEREEIYRRFQDPNDPLEWLCVSDVLNEGVDLPGINSLIFLRPTESRTLFIQQLGRGLRLTPDCEVLTVIDFVGHHRTAWLPLSALNDADAGTTSSSISELNFTPPKNCQVILDDLTPEILIKVRRSTETKREACLHAYLRLREQSDRPYPLDLWGRQDVPEFEVFRASYKSWILLRIAANHAAPWEKCLLDGDKAYDFLLSLERDWQQPRVYAYALVWGLVAFPNNDPDLGYDEFFNRFARWRVEYKPLKETKAFETVKKKLGGFLKDKALDATIWEQIPGELLVKEVEGRIRLTLEKDYKLRHGGILRSPADLVLHRRYDRPEIINHFGVQYDPAKHNSGFITLNKEIIIITKIDTSGATQRHQYQNKFCDNHTFEWQSQNQQRQDNLEGRAVLEHRQNGDTIHLFVQPRSHEKAYYCGKVAVIAADGNGPMNVTLELEQGLSEGAFKDLRSPVVRSIASMTTPAAGRQSMNPDDSSEMGLPVMLPFYPIRVAAGGFESGDAPGPEGFVNVAKFGFKPAVPDGLFVTRVVGKSMEPTIPSGNLCVFRNEVVGSREGRVLIVEQRRISDPETGGSYTVKRYRSKKVAQEDGWRHEVIELVPDNKEYPVIKLDATEEDTVRVIGELVFVLPVDAVVGESSTAT